MEIKFNKIAFIGLGLIGGSIARAIKKYYPDTKIIAHANHIETIQQAFAEQIISNNEFLSIDELAKADIIFLCSPVKYNIDYIKQLKPYLSTNTILTDVGSVKGDIHRAVNELGLSDRFIGGHPMAGSEHTGFEYSSVQLLENAYYVLTTNSDVDSTITSRFKDYIQSLGPIPITLSPEEHDFSTAAISHLPHLISASLVNLVNAEDNEDEILKTIAAGGFRDITRISSSSPIMWQNICLSNRDEILKLMNLYKAQFAKFEKAVSDSDQDELMTLFSNAKDYRDSLPVRSKGALAPSYEFYLDVEDEPGAIAMISLILALNQISIKNIGVLHNREFEQGVLGIEFYEDTAMKDALSILTKRGYTIHTKK